MRVLSNLTCEFESPPLAADVAAAPADAAAAVQAAGQTDHWLNGKNDSWECLHVCFSHSEKQPSLTHLPPYSLCEDAPEEGPEGAVRGGLFLEPQPHPLPLPLASSATSLSCLSLCSSSWSLC